MTDHSFDGGSLIPDDDELTLFQQTQQIYPDLNKKNIPAIRSSLSQKYGALNSKLTDFEIQLICIYQETQSPNQAQQIIDDLAGSYMNYPEEIISEDPDGSIHKAQMIFWMNRDLVSTWKSDSVPQEITDLFYEYQNEAMIKMILDQGYRYEEENDSNYSLVFKRYLKQTNYEVQLKKYEKIYGHLNNIEYIVKWDDKKNLDRLKSFFSKISGVQDIQFIDRDGIIIDPMADEGRLTRVDHFEAIELKTHKDHKIVWEFQAYSGGASLSAYFWYSFRQFKKFDNGKEEYLQGSYLTDSPVEIDWSLNQQRSGTSSPKDEIQLPQHKAHFTKKRNQPLR